MTTSDDNRPALEITCQYAGRPLAYRLFRSPRAVTIGPHPRATFVAPLPQGFPRRFRLLKPVRDGVRLRLGPGMSGKLTLRGKEMSVADVLAQPAQRRFLRDPGMFRQTELYPGDTARVQLDGAGDLRFDIGFCPAPEKLVRPQFLPDPLLRRTMLGSSFALLLLVVFLRLWGRQFASENLVVTQERFDRFIAPQLITPPKPLRKSQAEVAEAESKRKAAAREAAESRRHARSEGRLGRTDATAKETVLPKGSEDRLREKVSKTGLLAVLGNQKAGGSGLARLFQRDDSGELEQAMNGLAGAQLVAGKGRGGLGDIGAGMGGGGTGVGRFQGSGNLDVGAGRGRGRKGPSLGRGQEREVQVEMKTGTADSSGGLTREQINRVVRDHAAAIRYCFEKELQRQPNLSGKVELYWVIKPSGAADRIKIASSTLGNRAVEGCMERQVRNWQFPRSDSETIVASFPFFFFKAGA